MVIDEGKSILTDITKDTKMTARISQNLMLFGGVDHLRLKENPNMLVQNNAIMAEEGRDHPVPAACMAPLSFLHIQFWAGFPLKFATTTKPNMFFFKNAFLFEF